MYAPRVAALLRYKSVALEEAEFILVYDEQSDTYTLCDIITVEIKKHMDYSTTTTPASNSMFTAIERGQGSPGISTGRSNTASEYSALLSDVPHIKYIIFRYTRYIYSKPFNSFYFLSGLDGDNPMKRPKVTLQGLKLDDVKILQQIYGYNELTMQESSYLCIFNENILDIFYIFQLFSLVIWIASGDYYYSAGIVIIFTIFITAALIRIRSYDKRLIQSLHGEETVTVIREGEEYEISHRELVPGDVVVINKSSKYLTFDGIMIKGQVYVDIASISGVQNPVIKMAQLNQINTKIEKLSHDAPDSLFSGSRIVGYLNEGEDLLALVINTGYSTSKGRVFCKAAIPDKYNYTVQEDEVTYFKFLFGIGVLSFVIAMLLFTFGRNYLADHVHAVFVSLRLVTLSIPPSLPLAITMAHILSSRRLENQQIVCRNYRRIYVGGRISCVVFDKTGTLTKGSRYLIGYLTTDKEFSNLTFRNMKTLYNEMIDENVLYLLISCHTSQLSHNSLLLGELNSVEDEQFNDRIILAATGWKLNKSKVSHYPRLEPPQQKPGHKIFVDIIRRIPFSSDLKYTAVIARVLKEAYKQCNYYSKCYVKGDSSTILGFCKSETVPYETQEVVAKYTKQGYIVVAMGYKDFSFRDDSRAIDFPKHGMTFLGLLVFGDQLADGAEGVISSLHYKKFQTVMCTGDNIHTAVHVARQVGILPSEYSQNPADKVVLITATLDSFGGLQISANDYDDGTVYKPESAWADSWSPPNFVVEGESWEILDKAGGSHLDRIIIAGKVFAGMHPRQKKNLVELKRKIGYETCMVGDGSNDNEALAEADIGISLNNRESGLSSPFHGKDITTVPRLLNEGRTASAQLLKIFESTGCGSVLGLFTETFLYSMLMELGEADWIYIDLFLLMSIDLVLGYTDGLEIVSTGRLTGSFWSPIRIISNSVFIMVCIIFQMAVIFYLYNQEWYVPTVINHTHITDSSYETACIFYVLIYQVTFPAVVYSLESSSIHRNWPVLIVYFTVYSINTYILIYPSEFVVEIFKLRTSPSIWFRAEILVFLLVNLIFNILAELGFITYKGIPEKNE